MGRSHPLVASVFSGNGYRIGGQQANLEAFIERQWVTVNQELGSYPF